MKMAPFCDVSAYLDKKKKDGFIHEGEEKNTTSEVLEKAFS